MSPRDTPSEEDQPASATRAPRARPSIVLLVAMTGVGPFSMQIIIPSLPAMALALAVPYGTMQLTLTLYLIGVALGQLLYGPLSDRFGRKPLLLIGLLLYLLGSVAAAVAPGASTLIIARILQAVGACAGMVLGRAMIRDSYPRERSASVLGYVSTAMAVAPMLSPLLGSVLADVYGWRATMIACLVFGVTLLLAIRAWLPETLAQPADLQGPGAMLRAYVRLLALPDFRAYTAVTALSTGVFFAFAAGGPLVIIEGRGASPTLYATLLMIISVAWSAGSFTAARLSPRLGIARMLRLGTAVTLVGSAIALATALLAPTYLLGFFLPMSIAAIGNGMTQPNAIAAAVSVRPMLAGTASGLVGAMQMAVGATLTVLAGYTETGSGIATAVCMLGSSALILPFLRGVMHR